MKNIFRFLQLMVVFVLVLALSAVAFATGTDPAPAPAAAVTLMGWFAENKTAVFAVALAISELLAVTPWLKGNGLLHTILLALKRLLGKPVGA